MARALLEGIRIVEIGHPFTEYAGLVLANYGAEVFLVEPPEGTSARWRQPRVPVTPRDEASETRAGIPFLTRNANKRSVALNPGSADDMAKLRGLCERSNVVLTTAASPFDAIVQGLDGVPTVTVTDRLGLGTATIVGFAASGGMASSGWPDQPPCNAPSYLPLDGAGVYVAVLAVVAEMARRRGATISYEVPYEEAVVAAITPWTRTLHSYETHAGGQGTMTARLGPIGFPVYEAKDGYVRALAGTPRQWEALVKVLGSPEELVSGAWSDRTFRAENIDGLYYICNEFAKERSMMELFLDGQKYGLTISPVYTLQQFVADPHVRDREVVVPVEDPDFGTMEVVRPPLEISPAELKPAIRPAPALGEANDHLAAVLAEPEKTVAVAWSEFDASKPLAGTRVLELGFGAVVPEAASLLACLGAEIIKLESLVHVDFLRQVGLNGYMDVNNSPTFNQLNLGSKSIALDMTQPEARSLALDLVKASDAVMENMRGAVARNWGLDYESSRQAREDIVYLSSQGLGRGPYDNFQTYGPNLQTFSGVTSQWAHGDDPFPVGTTLNHPDHVAGKQALVPLLAALMRRDDEGEGCFLDATQVEAAAYLIGDRFLQQYYRDDELPALGNRSPDMAPHGCYPTAGEDRWIAIAVENDEAWRSLCRLVGEDWMRDESLSCLEGRLAAAADIDAKLGAWTSGQDVAALEQSLRDAGVAASRLVTGDDMAGDRAMTDAGFYPMIPHPTAGPRRYTGLPILQEGRGRVPARRPPLLGEHTEEVLYGVLGLDAVTVDGLMARKVTGN